MHIPSLFHYVIWVSSRYTDWDKAIWSTSHRALEILQEYRRKKALTKPHYETPRGSKAISELLRDNTSVLPVTPQGSLVVNLSLLADVGSPSTSVYAINPDPLQTSI